jgi:NADPH:quinone reductase-like Zn-dependent oxidoreductase
MKAVRIHAYGAEMGRRPENSSQLAAIATLVDSGKIKPVVETILPLSEARHTHEISQSSHARGKIVLRVME